MVENRTRRPVLVAIAVALVWVVIALIAAPYSGKLTSVATNSNVAFLPKDAESSQALELTRGFVEQQTTPALVVYQRSSGITEADRQRAGADAARFAEVPGVLPPVPPPVPSQDGQALQVMVPISDAEGTQVQDVVDRLREITGKGEGGLTINVAGPAGLQADLIEVFSSIDGRLLLVTLCVVLVILLIVYRSPVLWIIPLLSAGVSYLLSTLAVYYLADNDIIMLNGQAQGILTVLVFGAGTDYALLLIARYREELRNHPDPAEAMLVAWRGAAPAIIASGTTVIAGLLCLLLSGLESNQAMGPVSAVGIGATLVVMLTFLPALLLIGGRWAFWPRRPQFDSAEAAGGMWHRIAGFVARRARTVWLVTSLALAALAIGLTQFSTNTLSQVDLFTSRTDAVAGQETINRHYPGGLGDPVLVFTRAEAADRTAERIRGVAGIAEVQPVTPQTGAAPGQPAQPDTAEPKVVDGRVQLQATLADPIDSSAAKETVRQLRVALRDVPGADAVVGGSTAIDVDTADASDRDRNVIIPVVLVVIAIILAVLLRSLVAPVLLILTVALSFAATLGLCALLFKYVLDFPGIDSSFPLFAFVFLIALGIDYNIFLMSRVREEAVKHGTRAGTLRGLVVTGGVITSAGVVLAATFASLVVLPMVILVELGLAVAIGVLLDTVVVRSLLVPALAYDLGPPMWWPSRLARRRNHGDSDGPPDR
ncbi:MMPL family transporter [Micromonospora polyrhachis]|uniref:RND superfamily putative drug exporter n=1 Tax=Micromonospora polyrhachis TaxID=1282883 RepID=A0A7W7STR7_9ACTN|nr:MMPL family transporter [Micromonospora polyrhachis]MBB4960728.1 RND superfamily putative drug exporter [Micromonospora polyrhachis]